MRKKERRFDRMTNEKFGCFFSAVKRSPGTRRSVAAIVEIEVKAEVKVENDESLMKEPE
jgi:hypothetical protein